MSNFWTVRIRFGYSISESEQNVGYPHTSSSKLVVMRLKLVKQYWALRLVILPHDAFHVSAVMLQQFCLSACRTCEAYVV